VASQDQEQARPDRRYPLEPDQAEAERYRKMAEAARQAEADLWEPAGMVAGARVADVGCGPGAMLPALSAAAGPDGRVTAVDADPKAVAAATALSPPRAWQRRRPEGPGEKTGLEGPDAGRGDAAARAGPQRRR
jgi:ubiquinone/menaquinone biosynthesis C-methylase UbiE